MLYACPYEKIFPAEKLKSHHRMGVHVATSHTSSCASLPDHRYQQHKRHLPVPVNGKHWHIIDTPHNGHKAEKKLIRISFLFYSLKPSFKHQVSPFSRLGLQANNQLPVQHLFMPGRRLTC